MKFENGIEIDGTVAPVLYRELKAILDNGGTLGKVLEATELELFNYYTSANYAGVMNFNTYKESCKISGTKIVGEET